MTHELQRPLYQPAASVFAWVHALLVALLIVAGALITGNKAALSDPTWPQFVGQWYPTRETFVGGLRFEDSHRVIAAITGLATLAFAVFLQLRDTRPLVKKLAWAAFALVVVQALFGGAIILLKRPAWTSIVHGVLGQAYLCLAVALAVYVSRVWQTAPAPVVRNENRLVLRTSVFLTGALLVQLVLGAKVRHIHSIFIPQLVLHILLALVVTFGVVLLFAVLHNFYRDQRALWRMAAVAVVLVAAQFILGVLSIFANRARLSPEAPEFLHILISTSHVIGGAALLSALLALALRAQRLLAPQATAEGAALPREAEGSAA